MGHGGRRPVPLKHSKTCDSFNEKSRLGRIFVFIWSQTHCLYLLYPYLVLNILSLSLSSLSLFGLKHILFDSSGTPLIEEEPAREEVPVKKSKIWPLRFLIPIILSKDIYS